MTMRFVVWQPETKSIEVESEQEAWELLTSLSAQELDSARVLEDWTGGKESSGRCYLDQISNVFGDEHAELIGA